MTQEIKNQIAEYEEMIAGIDSQLDDLEANFDRLHAQKVAAVKAKRIAEADRIIDRLHDMQDEYRGLMDERHMYEDKIEKLNA